MAEQKEDRVVTLLGVDPGDVWCGWARLSMQYGDTQRRWWTAETGVWCVRERSMHEAVQAIFSAPINGCYVERFQQRTVGHQSWQTSRTARIIGAMEYVAEAHGYGWHTVSPGNPKLVEQFPIWPVLRAWRPKGWQTPSSKQWQHGLSAWRILMQGMLVGGFHAVLESLLPIRGKDLSIAGVSARPSDAVGDLRADQAHWSTRR